MSGFSSGFSSGFGSEPTYSKWKGAGMIWWSALDVATHKFCFVRGVGTNSAGTTGYLQQIDGSDTTPITLDDNNVSQVVQYYSDPNGDGSTSDGYSYPGHLVFKLFRNGSYQARADIIQAYGLTALEPYEYTISLQQSDTDLATGDPGIIADLSITDHTASPLVVGGKSFDYEIVDSGTNSALDILRQINYSIANDPTSSFLGKTGFNWPDMVIESGGSYETEANYVDGQDTTTTLHGFYVSRGGSDHPGFSRFQSNDETYYTPTTVISVINANLVSGWYVKVINDTQATTLYSGELTGSLSEAFNYGTGEAIEENDSITYYAARVSGTSYWEPITGTSIATGGDITFLDSPTTFTAVESWGWDASTDLAEFTVDGTNIDIDVDDADGDTKRTKIVAFWLSILHTGTYIEEFWGAFTVFSANHIRQNVSMADVVTHNTGLLEIVYSDNDVRYYRSDNSSPFDSTGTSQFMDYTGVPDVVETGVSGLTASEALDLEEISAVKIKTDQLTFSAAGYIDANIMEVNDNGGLVGTGNNGTPVGEA